jgi:hypothetical protein
METFEVYWPPSPFIGILFIVAGLIFAAVLWKKRQFIGASVCVLLGLAWIAFRVEDQYAPAFGLVMFVSLWAETLRTEQYKSSSKKVKVLQWLSWLPWLALSFFLLRGSPPDRIGLLPTSLEQDRDGGAFNGESINKDGLTATLIHVERDEFDVWRFREAGSDRRVVQGQERQGR